MNKKVLAQKLNFMAPLLDSKTVEPEFDRPNNYPINQLFFTPEDKNRIQRILFSIIDVKEKVDGIISGVNTNLAYKKFVATANTESRSTEDYLELLGKFKDIYMSVIEIFTSELTEGNIEFLSFYALGRKESSGRYTAKLDFENEESLTTEESYKPLFERFFRIQYLVCGNLLNVFRKFIQDQSSEKADSEEEIQERIDAVDPVFERLFQMSLELMGVMTTFSQSGLFNNPLDVNSDHHNIHHSIFNFLNSARFFYSTVNNDLIKRVKAKSKSLSAKQFNSNPSLTKSRGVLNQISLLLLTLFRQPGLNLEKSQIDTNSMFHNLEALWRSAYCEAVPCGVDDNPYKELYDRVGQFLPSDDPYQQILILYAQEANFDVVARLRGEEKVQGFDDIDQELSHAFHRLQEYRMSHAGNIDEQDDTFFRQSMVMMLHTRTELFKTCLADSLDDYLVKLPDFLNEMIGFLGEFPANNASTDAMDDTFIKVTIGAKLTRMIFSIHESINSIVERRCKESKGLEKKLPHNPAVVYEKLQKIHVIVARYNRLVKAIPKITGDSSLTHLKKLDEQEKTLFRGTLILQFRVKELREQYEQRSQRFEETFPKLMAALEVEEQRTKDEEMARLTAQHEAEAEYYRQQELMQEQAEMHFQEMQRQQHMQLCAYQQMMFNPNSFTGQMNLARYFLGQTPPNFYQAHAYLLQALNYFYAHDSNASLQLGEESSSTDIFLFQGNQKEGIPLNMRVDLLLELAYCECFIYRWQDLAVGCMASMHRTQTYLEQVQTLLENNLDITLSEVLYEHVDFLRDWYKQTSDKIALNYDRKVKKNKEMESDWAEIKATGFEHRKDAKAGLSKLSKLRHKLGATTREFNSMDAVVSDCSRILDTVVVIARGRDIHI